jgi:tetratricopeptide (TPR) repeat protein
VLGHAPSRRDEAVAGYRALLVAAPGDVDALANLGRFLSWTPGHLGEAVEAFRGAVALDPAYPGARLGLARTLAWSGANAEATALFDALLAEDPKDLESLLGRAQLARWTGDSRTARVQLARAAANEPDSARRRAERARLEIDAGRRGLARREARAALDASPGLYEGKEALDALHDVTAPRASVRFTATSEPTAFDRMGLAVPVELHLLPDTRLRIEPVFTRFTTAADGSALDRVSVGAEATQTGLPQGLYARGAYRLHMLPDAAPAHAGDLALGADHPGDLPLQLRVGARQRLLVDSPDAEGFAPLVTEGSGGATAEGLRDAIAVREAYAVVAAAPLPGLYLYGDGALGEIEGNARRSVSAGVGQDVLRVLRDRSDHALTVRYDVYALSVDAPDPRYYSPEANLTHTPGLEWRFTPGRWTLGLEGGVPLRADAPVGWLAGGFAGVGVGEHLDVAARVRTTDDTVWSATGATVAVSGRW